MASPQKSEAQKLLDKIHEQYLSEKQEIPEGFYTISQWREMWGVARSSVERYIEFALKNKLMEMRRFKIVTKGRYCTVAHYKATR
jgi:response regulator of citrate/malate metabolism